MTKVISAVLRLLVVAAACFTLAACHDHDLLPAPAADTPTPTETSEVEIPTATATAEPPATVTQASAPTDTPERGDTDTPAPTDTPEPPDTPIPTDTPVPTNTAVPPATDTPAPTATAEPTDTAVPTDTPVVGAAIITTFAGTGFPGHNGDGRPPLETHMYLPQDMTVGPDGMIYLVDWNNHRIRRIRDGAVETIAGTGELGDAKDGEAIYVQFNHPTNVCFDQQGRMIIAAWHNSLVKRLDLTTGYVENVAGTGGRSFGGDGGPANSAILDLPSSVVVDTNGNIIISDQANYRLRLVEPNGTIHTICGDGTPGYTGDGERAENARLNSPKGQSAPPAGRIDIDSQNRIYIADTGNHVIRLIDTDGRIRTIAGNGTPGYSGNGGPATAAQLNTPSDVAVGADGTVYVADTNNHAIRMIAPDGTITTVAGTGERGYSGDGGPADQARLDRPYGVTLGPDGTVYIADTHNHRYRRLTPRLPDDYDPKQFEFPPVDIIPCTNQVGTICTYAGTGQEGFVSDGKHRLQTVLYWPMDVEFTPRGRVIIQDWNNHKVREILPDDTITTIMGSDFVGDGPPDFSDLTEPGAPPLTVDLNHPTDALELPDGDIVIAAWHNHKIRKIDAETGLVRVLMGAEATFAGDGGPAKDARVNQPPHFTLDQHGNLFLIDQRNQRIRVLYNFLEERENAVIDTVAGRGTPPGFNGDGVALDTAFNFPTGGNPEPSGGITIDANGVIYFSDTNNHRIRRIEFTTADFKQGVVTTIAGTSEAGFSGDGDLATAAKLNFPQDIEIGPDGNIYFADANNHAVRRIMIDSGIIETVAGTGVEGYSGDGGMAKAAQLNRPFGVAFDQYGDLYISDSFNSRVRKVKLSDIPSGPEPIVPEDYRDSYVEVRDCRFSIEHGGVSIRVLADPTGANGYLANAASLPVGTVVVKEEFSGPTCEDEHLIGWRAMRKEAPGFDPEDADWHWQHLTALRQVLFDGKQTCIGCHVRPECRDRDYMCTVDAGEEDTPVELVLEGLPASIVAISGTSSHDVYAVGADASDGNGPSVLHYNGQHWRYLRTGATGDLWWISTTPIDGSFYLAGENGLILRYDLANRTFERHQTPGGALLFGIWGTAPNNLYAVGGTPGNESTGGVIWHYDGTVWTPVDLSGVRAEGMPTLYKVWGRGANDVWAVGRLGVVLHYEGSRWTPVNSSSVRPLFTVHGTANDVVAVGGFFDGVILELAGPTFANRTPDDTPQMNGVFLRTNGTGVAVGREGSVAFRRNGQWTLQDPPVDTPWDFHGAWVDPHGGIWAVGGDLSVDQTNGMIGYGGSETIGSEIVEEDPCGPGADNPEATVSYQNDIAPLFERSGCMTLGCHGGTFPASGYDLRTHASSFVAGVEARTFDLCAIAAGNPDASFLVEKLGASPRAGVRMPNGRDPLTGEEVNLVRTWILEGAPNN